MASYEFSYLVTKSVTVRVAEDTYEAARRAADVRVQVLAHSQELGAFVFTDIDFLSGTNTDLLDSEET